MTRLYPARAALVLAIILPAAACTTMQQQYASGGAMAPTDGDFATAAYTMAQLDEQTGKLAATKASDPRIQQLAANMSAEAQMMYPKLQAALVADKRPVPSAVSPQVAADVSSLSGLSGPAFDKQFLATQLAAHKQALVAMNREQGTVKNTVLRDQLALMMPVVQDNLATLTSLSQDMNKPT